MAGAAQARKKLSLSIISPVEQKLCKRTFGRVGKRGGRSHSFLLSRPKSFRVRNQWSDSFGIKPFTQHFLTWCSILYTGKDLAKSKTTRHCRTAMKSGIVILILRNKQHHRVVTVLIRVRRLHFCSYQVNCEVMPLRSFPNFKLAMSSHRKELRGAWAIAYLAYA